MRRGLRGWRSRRGAGFAARCVARLSIMMSVQAFGNGFECVRDSHSQFAFEASYKRSVSMERRPRELRRMEAGSTPSSEPILRDAVSGFLLLGE